jgi:endonuclease/exonuclease/phosphatase family metal-dependent hydrolase
MGQFRAAIDHAELLELRCANRKFSWSNERQTPTLVNLDRIFCNAAWDGLFSPYSVHALSTSHSDHCPLLLAGLYTPPRKARFRFENF